MNAGNFYRFSDQNTKTLNQTKHLLTLYSPMKVELALYWIHITHPRTHILCAQARGHGRVIFKHDMAFVI